MINISSNFVQAKVKPQLAEWLNMLLKRGFENFLICVVVGERKLQLRQTVVDKIKVDFLIKEMIANLTCTFCLKFR